MLKMPREIIGLWGNIVFTLRDKKSRLELRAVPQVCEAYNYIAEKVATKTGKPVEAIISR